MNCPKCHQSSLRDVTCFGPGTDGRPTYLCITQGCGFEGKFPAGQRCPTCQCYMAHSGYRPSAGGPAVHEYRCDRCDTRRDVPEPVRLTVGVDYGKPGGDYSVEARSEMSEDGKYVRVVATLKPEPATEASKRGVAFAKALRAAAKKDPKAVDQALRKYVDERIPGLTHRNAMSGEGQRAVAEEAARRIAKKDGLGAAYGMGIPKRQAMSEEELAKARLTGVPVKVLDEGGRLGGPYVIDEREWRAAAGIPLGPVPEFLSPSTAADTTFADLLAWERESIFNVFGLPKEMVPGYQGTCSFIDDPLWDEEKLAQESQRWLDPEEMDAAEGAGLSNHVRPFRYLVGAFGSPELLAAIDRYDDEWPLERAKEPRGRMTLTEWLRRQHLNEKPYGR